MKTQISNLRSGTKKQILNATVNYSTLPNSTSHRGHSGSSKKEVEAVWARVTSENPISMKVIVNGVEMDLIANWSLSRQTVSYTGVVSKNDLEQKFYINAAETATPYITIISGNIIIVSNGKKEFTHICPSLVEIL